MYFVTCIVFDLYYWSTMSDREMPGVRCSIIRKYLAGLLFAGNFVGVPEIGSPLQKLIHIVIN